MVLDHTDVILGKLAIGRSYLSRPDALRIAEEIGRSAGSGRKESFGQAAVRLGFLPPVKIDELLGVLQNGALICRGTCGESYRLAAMSPDQTVACGRCRGPLFVAGGVLVPTPAAGEADPGSGGQTFMSLDAPEIELPVTSAVVHEEEEEEEGDDGDVAGNTFLDLEIELPDDPGGGSPPPPVETQVPATGGDAEGTLEMDLPGETTLRFDGPIAFEPFAIQGREGSITVMAPIGKGGMGTVYRAQHADGRVMALKVLGRQAALTEEAVERFRREVRLTSGLEHPGIVRVHEAGIVSSGEMKGQPYYAMDYVQGRDLERWRGEGPRSAAECVRLMIPVCDAMDYAHGRGVVHRDLKPGNILVRDDGDAAQVVDFGLAKTKADMQNLTQTGDIVGTPTYMPPEQALGNRQLIGPPTDVYALGAILYFLLTGRPPFKAPSAYATIAKVVREAPRAPSSWNPEISPELEQIVLKALEKQPVDRFPTCGDLGRALTALV